MSDPQAERADPAGEDVRRLSPLTVLVTALPNLPQALIGLTAAWFSIDLDQTGIPFVVLLVPVLALVMGLTALSWWRFTYVVQDDDIRLSSGLIARTNRSLPFDRIQDVNIEQPLLARIFGLARVRFETGSGGGGEEGELKFVSLAEADQLRLLVQHRRLGTRAAVATAAVTEEQPGRTLFAMSTRRVLLAGCFKFSLVFMAVIGAALQNMDWLIDDDWWSKEQFGQIMGYEAQLESLSAMTQIIGALILAVTVLVVGFISGIIRSLLRDSGFVLERTDTGFRRRRGLLTLTDIVVPIHRIQAALIETGPIRRRLGWYGLKIQSLASEGEKEPDHELAPFARVQEIDAILAETPIKPWWNRHGLFAADSIYWQSVALCSLPIPSIMTVVFHVQDVPLLPVPFLIWALLMGVLEMRRKRHLWGLIDGHLIVHDGLLRQRLTILPAAHVQSADIKDGPLYRFAGFTNLVVGVAGGSGIAPLTIHAMPRDLALQLRRALLDGTPGTI